MNRESIFFGVAGLVIGFLLGVLVGGKTLGGGAASQGSAQGVAPVTNAGDMLARNAELETIVAKDPKNVKAWISLGNSYFDSNDYQKSIKAYGKALELDPKNPDVLTDQGLMFRAVGFFDKALDNFKKAQAINPQHAQSLFNMGIVYAVDLKQADKAKAALEGVVRLGGNSEMVAQAKEMLKKLSDGK